MKLHKFAVLLCLILSATMSLVAQDVSQPQAAPAAPPAVAEKASIQGTVTKAGNSAPLKGVQVSLQRTDPTPASTGRAGVLAGINLQDLFGGQGNIGNLAGGVPQSATTDAAGHFTFTNVQPGQYRIYADRENYVRAEYGQKTATGIGTPLTVTAVQVHTADISMSQSGLISGKVIDSYGEAVAQASVQAMSYTYANGQRTLAQAGSAQTSDLGEYRLFSLPPGEYFVTVIPRPDAGGPAGRGGAANPQGGAGALAQLLGSAGGLHPVFYPNTMDYRQATPIPVALSEEVRGIDFNIRPTRTATVSGHVVAPFSLQPPPAPAGRGGFPGGAGGGAGIQGLLQGLQGARGQTAQVSLTRDGGQVGIGALASLGLGGTTVGPDGVFEMKDVAPGLYSLSATARDAAGKEYSAKTRIDVGSNDITNLALTVHPVVELRGKILVDSPPQTFDISKLRISLVAEDSAALGGVADLLASVGNAAPAGRGGGLPAGLADGLPGGQIVSAPVAADGSFLLKNVGADAYRVRITNLQGGYLQSGRIGNDDALGSPLTVGTEPTTLQLQLGFAPGRVSGTVVDAKGTAYSGAVTALVPDETHRGRTDLYFSATTDLNGRFNFANVPPGNYKLLAWDEIPSGAYQYPDFIRRFEERGQPITIDKNGAANAEVMLIPAH